MAKRMGDENYYRVLVEVQYDITYKKYNPEWEHTRKTTPDGGSNGMFVWDTEPTHQEHCYYLGPFTTIKTLNREFEKWEKHYLEGQDSYKNLRITRHEIEIAEWKEV